MGKVWTGMRQYNCTREQFNAGLQDYIGNMINYPKAATLTAFGDPTAAMGLGSLTSSLGSLGSLFGLSGAKQNDIAEVDYALRALNGYGHLNLDSSMAEALLDSSNKSGSADVVRSFMLPMIYDGEKPPDGAWGKKLNALPMVKESGTMMEYRDVVS
jgi:hypothetical protein